MGCKTEEGKSPPTLLCFFETGNEEQASYCLKLKESFKNEKSINYRILSGKNMKFKIQFKIRNIAHNIQTTFDNSDNAMNQALQKMYGLLK